MDPQVQPSFIPKAALNAQARGGGMGLLFLIALLIFVASIVAAGGAFGYTRILEGTIANKDASLRKAEGAFDANAIQDLLRLDMRLTQARQLLSTHVAPSAILSFLSTITLQRVQYTSFDYQLQADGSANVTLNGIADSFSSVALQSDQFGASKVLRDVIFSGISVGDSGKVNFSVTSSVEPSLILYSRNLQATQ
jgi:hypothetical protein